MSDVIEAAKVLLNGTSAPHTEYARALVDIVCNMEPVVGLVGQEKLVYIERELGLRAPEACTDFWDLNTGDMSITITPMLNEKNALVWEVFIPATTPAQHEVLLDDDDKPLPFEEGTAEPLEPWGSSEWSTLQSAVAFVGLTVRSGNVTFNDGTVAG